jgi:hypothetical protein
VDPFDVLGLPPTASPEQVKAAYRAAARRLHPDAGGDEESFRTLRQAADEALRYASGAAVNPYLPREDHIRYVADYDRHAHAPAPPPNVWSRRFLGGALFWIVPVAGAVFMLSALAGPYFLPVYLGSMTVFGLVVWWIVRRRSG